MAWIGCKKGDEMVPHSWISESLEMFVIANNLQDLSNNSVKSWELKLNASGEKLEEVDIRKGNFYGDSVYPLLLACVWFH